MDTPQPTPPSVLTRACLAGGLVCLALATGVRAENPAASLRADHDAWVTAGRIYQQRVATDGIGAAEAGDYAAYLAELRDRVATGCAALEAAGAAIPDGVNCPRQAPLSMGVPVDGAPAPSRDEARAALDAELNAALGEFDELLLREQDRARALRPREPGAAAQQQAGQQGSAQGQGGGAGQQAGGASGAEAGQGQAQAGSQGQGQQTGGGQGQSGWTYSGSSGQQTAAGAQGTTTGDGPQGSGTDAGAGSSSGQGSAASRPADLPDPSGDDVVARQLREAAERETDPELKARLWEEYRRYRRGIQ